MFLQQAREDFIHTGAIAPSSRFLARAVTAPLRPQGPPLRVMEAGAGTGALTGQILQCLPAGSKLDIYELNPIFARHLALRFGTDDPNMQPGPGISEGRKVTVRVNNKNAQEIPEEPRYDAIISGLPLNNFEPSQVKQILQRLFASLKPGGVLSYFEYLLIRELKSLTTGRQERRRLRRVGRITGGFLEKYEYRREAVFLNIPPALVHQLRKPS